MTCTKCSCGMWTDPDGNDKDGFVWCSHYHGWMNNNGSCYNDDTRSREKI